ncbi:uncharacterized protein RBU33_019048 isoform 2-T2 [Hipposideros larvatus]
MSFLDEKLSNFFVWSYIKVKMLGFFMMPSLCGLLQFDHWEFSTLRKFWKLGSPVSKHGQIQCLYSQDTTEALTPSMFSSGVNHGDTARAGDLLLWGSCVWMIKGWHPWYPPPNMLLNCL